MSKLRSLIRLGFFIVATVCVSTVDGAERPAHPKPSFVEYVLTNDPIDVVIPCHPKDAHLLEQVVMGIRSYGKNIRRIIVVSDKKLTDVAEWFDEKKYPFSKLDIAQAIFNAHPAVAQWYLSSPYTRIGWMFQQFVKLYASYVIPNISSNVLVLDADSIFMNPVEFTDEQNRPLFNIGSEYYDPYFRHADRLLPGFRKVYWAYSGITHHMLFQRAVLDDLFLWIRAIHGIEPWRAICKCIDLRQIYFSPFSEYELYFNFMLQRSEQARLRPLRWKEVIFDQNALAAYKKEGYAYVSCHVREV